MAVAAAQRLGVFSAPPHSRGSFIVTAHVARTTALRAAEVRHDGGDSGRGASLRRWKSDRKRKENVRRLVC